MIEIKRCEECQTDNYPCDECERMDDEKMICKSTTKLFMLTDKDLKDVSYEEARNPYYSSRAPMRLYNKGDIKDIFCRKYEVCRNNISCKINEISEMKKNKKQNRVGTRFTKIMEKLKKAIPEFLFDIENDPLVVKYVERGSPTMTSIVSSLVKKNKMIEKFGEDVNMDTEEVEMYFSGDMTLDELGDAMKRQKNWHQS